MEGEPLESLWSGGGAGETWANQTAFSFSYAEEPDPTYAPIPDSTKLGELHPQQALFVELFVSNPRKVIARLQQFWPQIAAQISREIGMGIILQDSRLARRWLPLKASTIAARRRAGRMDDYPYSPETGRDWLVNKWGSTTTQDGTSLITGVGWREPSDDQKTPTRGHRARLDQQAGTKPSRRVGRGRHTMIPPRPLGLTEPMRARIKTSLESWAQSNADVLMASSDDEPSFFVQFSRSQSGPLWSGLP